MRYAPTLVVGPISKPKLSPNGRTMIVSMPLALRRSWTRKSVMTKAADTPKVVVSPRVDETVIKAIVRARRWQAMLESGKFATIRQLAATEQINESYVSRYLRLALLSPSIVKAALDGTLPSHIDLSALLKVNVADWQAQDRLISQT